MEITEKSASGCFNFGHSLPPRRPMFSEADNAIQDFPLSMLSCLVAPGLENAVHHKFTILVTLFFESRLAKKGIQDTERLSHYILAAKTPLPCFARMP